MLILSTFETPAGRLQVRYDEHFVYNSLFTSDKPYLSHNPMTSALKREIEAYFDDPRHRFNLPLKPQGSPFQQKVWNELLIIPVGRTLSYGDLAKQLQTAARAIGQACKANPLALFIPCHRIVGKDNPGGYMGDPGALGYKHFLLNHESVVSAPSLY